MAPKFLKLFKPKSVDGELSAAAAEILVRARGLLERGQLSEAAAEYRSILALHPGHWDALNTLASIAVRTGDIDTAIRLYTGFIERRRDHAVAYYKRGNAANALGLWDSALKDYERAIKIDPCYAHAFCNRGAVFERLGRWDEALKSYERALQLDPNDAFAHFNRASVLREQKKFDEALAGYERAISFKPDYADAYVNRGTVLMELRQFETAVMSYDTALEMQVSESASRLAHYSRGLALMKLMRWQDALAAFERTLALQEDHAESHFYHGKVLHELGRFKDAISSFDRAIDLTPAESSPYLAHASRGFALAALNRFDEALGSFERSVEIKDDHVDAHYAIGYVLRELHRYEDAVAAYDRAIALDPDASHAFAAHCRRAFLLKDLKRLEDALASYDRAVELKSDDPEVYLNRGCVLQELSYHEEAIVSFSRAIVLKPDVVEAYQGRGFSLLNRGRHDLAIASFDQAIALKPDQKYLLGFRRYVQMQVCDWDGHEAYLKDLEVDLRAGRPVSAPFQVLALVDLPILHRLAAEIWVREECPQDDRLGAILKQTVPGKIRVGYFSADFRNHPVALLTADLFETHDRSRFEIIAFAFGPRVQDEVRARLERSFDRFIDVSEKSDWDVAATARKLGLDIAVDLGGFTEFARPKVFAMRAAPIQMSYIGYLGTMGAPYMDYLLADPVIIPAEEQHSYSEKIIYLPSYQVNDSKRPKVERAMQRAALGLPDAGFVFSCFNANHKIFPATFAMWMRILARAEGSYLFLYAGNAGAERNLHAEALQRGIDPGRIVFGKYLHQADYLARFRAMDLFLDTLPYNAGTTASDALWAGLPVLTLAGRGFAGRVAASLLTAIEMPELIASTAAQYEETAIRLAANPLEILHIKQKLERHRSTTALFDTRLFTRSLESAYLQVHERWQAGLPPETLVIAPATKIATKIVSN